MTSRLGNVIMLIETEVKGRMPIRLPGAELVRRRIAEVAAQISGRSVDHYLQLIGPIEPVLASLEREGAPWRLSACYGSYHDLNIVDQAVQTVQRTHPLMD